MSKPYLEADFSAQISQDLSWRLKEISDLKTAVTRADDRLRGVLLRALVTICYAHWEGYVRFSARKYLEHIALRKFQYRKLDRQFVRNYFLPRLAELLNTKKSVSERCNLIDNILDSENQRFTRVNVDLINTKANLNFDVFTDICLVCSVPVEIFSDNAIFIDVMLLKRRNAIAHGEDTFITVEGLEEFTIKTVTIMRTFGNELENHVYRGDYKFS